MLSYSAGSHSLDPHAYRIVGSSDDRLAILLETYPDVCEFLGDKPPIVVSCYPASLGTFSVGIFIDTYLRQENVSRALLLAADGDHTAFLLGQPLPLLQFLLRHVELGLVFPRRTVVITGGYVCPSSAEEAILSFIRRAGGEAIVFHAYGVAEVEYGCLIGRRRTPEGEVIYVPATSHVEPVLQEDRLCLRFTKGLRCGEVVETGDFATPKNGGLVIRNSIGRFDPRILNVLDAWTLADWRRLTGYAARVQDEFVFQVREGAAPLAPNEIPFHEFAGRFGSSWLNKPRWTSLRR